MTRWSGSSAGHRANSPPLLPSADKAINPSLLWASATLTLWAFAAYCSVGPAVPTGGATLCTCRLGEEFKLKVKYVVEFFHFDEKAKFERASDGTARFSGELPSWAASASKQ